MHEHISNTELLNAMYLNPTLEKAIEQLLEDNVIFPETLETLTIHELLGIFAQEYIGG